MPFKLFGRIYPFNKRKTDPPAAVYAGPEYFRRRSGGKPEGEVLDVYAGPEFFEEPPEKPDFPEEDAPLPPEEAPVYAGPEPSSSGEERASLVYAGPEFFAARRNKAPEVAIGVYAGPQPFPGMGMNAPVPPKEDGKADGEA